MNSKILKYNAELSAITDSPDKSCLRSKSKAFRWVHTDYNENDFIPEGVKKAPLPRMLDKTDKICISYGLSLFTSLQEAKEAYLEIYNRRRKGRYDSVSNYR